MVRTTSLVSGGSSKHKERKADNIVVDKEFISCKEYSQLPTVYERC
jgi:hypothetical protein